MTQVPRFNNAYGNHTQSSRGYEQYRVTNAPGDDWIGSERAVSLGFGATRLLPRTGDFQSATPWGMFSHRVKTNPYLYGRRGGYTYRGHNNPETMALPISGMPSGCSVARSSTSVALTIPPYLIANANNSALSELTKGLNLGVFLGELPSTLSTLGDIFQGSGVLIALPGVGIGTMRFDS